MVYMEEFKKKKPAFSEACERLYKRISELATTAPQTFKLQIKAKKKNRRQSDTSAKLDSITADLKKINLMQTDSLLQESTFTVT